MNAPVTTPLQGAAAISLAVIGGRLEAALSQADMVQVLVAASDLDRMVRNLGPLARTADDRAALVRAQTLVGNVLTRLESDMTGQQASYRREKRLRLAYALTDAA